MKKLPFIRKLWLPYSVACLFILPANASANDDEFGISIAPSVETKIIDVISVSLEGEVRSRDMSRELERLALGMYVGYKPFQYAKAEIGYTFIDQHKPEYTDAEGIHTEKYWAPKHELEASLFGYLPIGVMEISVRERYEYTIHQEVSAKQWSETEEAKQSAVVKKSKTEHVLRSRIQISAKIPKTSVSTYGSLDIYNNLADSGELFNFRVIYGCDYAITNAHKIGLYWRGDLFYGKTNHYLLGVKYRFVF